MASKIVLPAVALVLALAFASGDALKCYECKSVGAADDKCSGEELKAKHKPVECSVNTMRAWHNTVQHDPTLTQIARVFEVYSNTDTGRHHDPPIPMACVKMNLRVNNDPVTLRTCQTAKTADVDPCKTTREKISKEFQSSTSVEYCGMCETDNCNGSYTLSPTMILSIVPLIGSILLSLVYSSA